MKFPEPHEATIYRRQMCRAIAAALYRQGYDVDWRKVNRNYIIFRRWYNGRLALGYLIRQTGIKRLPEG